MLLDSILLFVFSIVADFDGALQMLLIDCKTELSRFVSILLVLVDCLWLVVVDDCSIKQYLYFHQVSNCSSELLCWLAHIMYVSEQKLTVSWSVLQLDCILTTPVF